MSGDRQLTVALSRCRRPLFWIAGFSLVINILMLTSSIYMMQVFDRVLASGSLGTLLFLTLAAAGALGLMAAAGFRPVPDSLGPGRVDKPAPRRRHTGKIP